ncbi:CAP domain-containing protein [Chlorobium sp. BLA1]|uniref:CAP domain-containing protein n=1 Tax=Candidatus Chlorobium masyuteum TaxID=2716876 RepID=UPI0014201E40|nr:CAP domain-containing protein [Candidatus Chlorobium masyuteum]NHQ61009.1 CAP domain-containing protein [Candidatus Chlorobium masyuteum]
MMIQGMVSLFRSLAGIVLPVALLIAHSVTAFAADGSPYGGDAEILQASHGAGKSSRVSLSDEEAQLYRLLMDYRRSEGKPPIPVSPNLSRVARLHVRDLEAHPPSGSCNLHSWSEYGSWQPVCYNGGESVQRMWSKPRELTSYNGNGFEVAACTSSGRMLPSHALSLWEGSSAHNAVITNSGKWERLQWNAVGVAISGSYAVVWFGEESDPSGR